MQQYIIRRLLLNFLVIFLVATMVFMALRIDTSSVLSKRVGTCASGNAQTDPTLYQQCVRNAKAELGIDKSLPRQYWDYVSKLARLDLGVSSLGNKDPIIDEIKSRIGPSVELGLLQIFVALLVALPVGIISAVRQDTWIDYFLRFFSIAFLGIPVFVVAIFSILFVSQYGGTFLQDWLSPQGHYSSLTSDPQQNMKNMLAPALVGGFGTGAVMMRFLRSQMLEVLRQDYVRTAWAKGLKERVVIVRHALKNALIPVLTIVGILLGSIVSGNVVLEYIYRIPGIGFYVTARASQAADFNAVQGVVIVVAMSLVFINLAIDVAYGWLDPRIRYS